MKKVISLLLSVIMLFSSITCITAIAADSVVLGENHQIRLGENIIATYSDDFKTLTVSGKGYMSNSYYREEDINYDLTSRVENIIIEEGIKSADSRIFSGTQITELNLPDSLEKIDLFCHSKKLQKINFGKNLKDIGTYAFSDCVSLKTIELPKSVTRIGVYAFMGCTGLTVVDFGDCAARPNTLSDVSYDVFKNCKNIEKFVVSPNNSRYSAKAGVLFSCDQTTLLIYPQNKSSSKYKMPDTVDYIFDKAFCHNENLKEVTLSSNLKTIGLYAFYDIKNLNNITIPKSVTRICRYAFAKCPKLGKVTFLADKAVPTIELFAFANAKAGIKIYTPNKTIANKVKAKLTSKESEIDNADIYANGNLVHTGITFKENVEPYYPDFITLSTSVYTYDGKVKKPSVTVQHVHLDGCSKFNSKEYKISYSKGRKNVGKYTVTVKYNDADYGNASVKRTFIIVPKSTSISSITAKSKGFKVKWKKQATQTTGYQIQYATDSKFTTNAKTVTITKNKTMAKTITKLSPKKKYYVRVRTYKTVNGVKYYSNWSSAKTVTTKK